MLVFKIDVIFELAFRQQLDVRARGDEQILFQAGIGVADILGASGNSTFLVVPSARRPANRLNK